MDDRPCPPGFTRRIINPGTSFGICVTDKNYQYIQARQNQQTADAIRAERGIYFSGHYVGQTLEAREIANVGSFWSSYEPRTDWLAQASPYIVGTASLAAGALLPGFGIAAGLANVAQTVEQSERTNMALNIGQLLGGIGSAIGGIQGGVVQPYTQTIGSVLQAGGQIASAFQPQPQASPVGYMPSYNPPLSPVVQQPIVRTMAGGVPVVQAAKEMVTPILAKVAAALGRRGVTLAYVASLAKRLAKFFASPEAIALYLGLTVHELYTAMIAHEQRKRRRMNPANSKALRRAASRIKSFHKLCTHTDLLKTRRRSVGRSCGTCRKSPCRC